MDEANIHDLINQAHCALRRSEDAGGNESESRYLRTAVHTLVQVVEKLYDEEGNYVVSLARRS